MLTKTCIPARPFSRMPKHWPTILHPRDGISHLNHFLNKSPYLMMPDWTKLRWSRACKNGAWSYRSIQTALQQMPIYRFSLKAFVSWSLMWPRNTIWRSLWRHPNVMWLWSSKNISIAGIGILNQVDSFQFGLLLSFFHDMTLTDSISWYHDVLVIDSMIFIKNSISDYEYKYVILHFTFMI